MKKKTKKTTQLEDEKERRFFIHDAIRSALLSGAIISAIILIYYLKIF